MPGCAADAKCSLLPERVGQTLAQIKTVAIPHCSTSRRIRQPSRRGRQKRVLDAASGYASAIRGCASTLRLHPVTLRALAAAGTVPAVKIGRAWRFLEVDLLAWARPNYCRADAVGDKESTCRSTNVQIAASGGPRSPYQTEAAYAALVAPRTARKHGNGSITCAPISGAFIVSANAPPTRGRTP
jgi:hypothetical protein